MNEDRLCEFTIEKIREYVQRYDKKHLSVVEALDQIASLFEWLGTRADKEIREGLRDLARKVSDERE